jgi:hypothetical protein
MDMPCIRVVHYCPHFWIEVYPVSSCSFFHCFFFEAEKEKTYKICGITNQPAALQRADIFKRYFPPA